ncbi:LpxL/LpxP family Kdo(2)-lipid IV(A) lauroyl/palmitoleoyl acyltransferase [Pontibacterium sp.]|uniref:LpxL/LpxP family Kdo(2)-lipid IV(A) lauroyl/palmitoleoyl acyltransferase n=1 Tax=Pontibacterium sp. TaxID=2036026 RepID=UPI0035163129
MSKKSDLPLYHPRLWPTWLTLALLWCCSQLPFDSQLSIGKTLGLALTKLAKRRHKIAKRNLELCFPNMSHADREELLKEVFIQQGMGLIEMAQVWWPRPKALLNRYHIEGLEHYHRAKQAHQGVLLLGGHYSVLELGALFLSNEMTLDGMYRANNNPVLDQIGRKGRARFFETAIERRDIRQLIKRLKQGKTVWYAPDQDFGRKNTVFAPFFGISAATLTATSRIVKMTGVPVLFISQHRNPDNTYTIRIAPPLTDFPSGNDAQDATRLNLELEKIVRTNPSQYMWVHRRFKTQPDGKNLYQ